MKAGLPARRMFFHRPRLDTGRNFNQQNKMTNEQKQKVLQLLELCVDNSKEGEYACVFDAYPSCAGSISVRVYLGKQRAILLTRLTSATLTRPYGGEDAKLDAAIVAIQTLPERALPCLRPRSPNAAQKSNANMPSCSVKLHPRPHNFIRENRTPCQTHAQPSNYGVIEPRGTNF